MKLDFIEIKSKKQENGLWVTPLNLKSLNKIPPKEKELLFSAIVNVFSEKFDCSFRTELHDNGFFIITTNKIHYIKYDKYYVEDNKLYFLKDKNQERYIKLRKIK